MAGLIIASYIHKSILGAAKSSGYSTTKGPRKETSGFPLLFNLKKEI